MVGFGSLFVYTFSVFMKPLGAEFGWSREAISRGFGFAAISVAICSPTIGQWLDRYGPRRIILPCMTVFGSGIASLALLRPHLWQFYATCILLEWWVTARRIWLIRAPSPRGSSSVWEWPWHSSWREQD